MSQLICQKRLIDSSLQMHTHIMPKNTFSILKLIVEKILELLRLELKTPTSKTCASEIKIVFVGKVIDKFIVEGKYILKFCPLQKV